MIFDSVLSMARRTNPVDPQPASSRMMLSSLPTAGIRVDKQNVLVAAQVFCFRFEFFVLMRSWFVQREIDGEGRTFAWFASRGDGAVVIFDDAVGDDMTQACVVAGFLGGETGVEKTLYCCFVHARAGVADR